MRKYELNEIRGKYQGQIIIVEAETSKEACEKVGMTEMVKPHQRFSTMYFGEIYECYEEGKHYQVEWIAHR